MPSELELGRSQWDGVSVRRWQNLQGGTKSRCHKEGLWVAQGRAGALPSPESPSRLEMCLLHTGCVTRLPWPLHFSTALPAGLGCPPTAT